jgi:DNA helicase-2/ATP-dependent DNA helicase PcrA
MATRTRGTRRRGGGNSGGLRVYSAKYKGFCARKDGGCGKRWGEGSGERIAKVETVSGAWYFCEPCALRLDALPLAERTGDASPQDDETGGARSAATWIANLAAFILSVFQAAFIRAVREDNQHLVLSACAGSGKTKTIELAFARVPEATLGRALVVAFNVSIKDELAERLRGAPGFPQVRTVHGCGFSLFLRPAFKAKTGRDLPRNAVDWNLAESVYRRLWPTAKGEAPERDVQRNRDLQGPVVKLASLTRCTLDGDLAALVARHNIELNGAADDLDEAFSRVGALVAELEQVFWAEGKVDGDGQVYLPVALDLAPSETFRTVFVDECQDLSAARVALARKLAGKTGRIVAVGDRRQAIYGFSGADPESMDNLHAALAATPRGVQELPLDICYRCPKAVIRLVRQLNLHPTIEARPDAPEGEVASASEATWLDRVSGETDTLVLSRRNVDLVGPAFKLLRRGVRCRIQGRDIAAGLKALARKCAWKRDNGSLAQWQKRLDEYVDRTVRKLADLGHDAQVEHLEDRAATLRVIATADGVDDVPALLKRIDDLFADAGDERVVFSTVHKAKGLEAEDVYILRPDLIPFPFARQAWEQQQERHLQYVAYTRPKLRLVFVGEAPDGGGALDLDEAADRTADREVATLVASAQAEKAQAEEPTALEPFQAPTFNALPAPLLDESGTSIMCIRCQVNVRAGSGWVCGVCRDGILDSGCDGGCGRPTVRLMRGMGSCGETCPIDLKVSGGYCPRCAWKGCTACGRTEAEEAAPVALADLPVLPTKGKRGAVEATWDEWLEVRDLYREAGLQADLDGSIGQGTRYAWRQYAFLVGLPDEPPVVRVSTTIDVRTKMARGTGENAIDVARIESRDGPPLKGSRRKVLRTLNWQGRVCERINGILRDAGVAQ